MEFNAILPLLLFIVGGSCGYKILVVFPVTSRGHWSLGNSLARGLVQAGHDVTMISAFPDKNPPTGGKFTQVLINEVYVQEVIGSSLFEFEKLDPIQMPTLLNSMGTLLTMNMLQDENYKKLIDSDQSFDLIVVEQFFNDALKALMWHYKAPLILFSPLEANLVINRLVGNSGSPSYIPNYSSSYGTHMDFFERLYNSILTLNDEIYYHLSVLPSQDKIAKEYFPGSPDLQTYINNVSILFVNSHESVSFPVPAAPNVINLGGFHLRPPKDLPKDLKDIMDNAPEGIVYFSLGSNIDTAYITDKIKSAIFKSLGKLKQKVIIKWHEEVLDVPQNFIIRKWCPQQEILAHPNVKLFVTHGGLLSSLETVYHGVPVLTLPVFGDQRINAKKQVTAGYGLSTPLSGVTEKSLSENIYELLNNPKYTENVKQRSRLMKDRPVKPMDLAVYWCEFVIRHKGATHLRVAALDLTWYQYFLLDVVAFCVIVSVSIVFVIYTFVIKKICCSRKSNVKSEKLKSS